MTSNEYCEAIRKIEESDAEYYNVPLDLDPVSTSFDVHRLQTATMTPEEANLTRFTRRNLQRLANWDVWDAGFNTQIDDNAEAKTFGEQVVRSSIEVDEDDHTNVLRMHWQNVVKPCGKRKFRVCIDGSRCAAP
jgi:hypothetical protein